VFFESDKKTFLRNGKGGESKIDVGDGKSRKDFIDNESIWPGCQRIGLENRGGILAPIQGIDQGSPPRKVSPNVTPFFSPRIGSLYSNQDFTPLAVRNLIQELGRAGELRIRGVQEDRLDRGKVRFYTKTQSGMIPNWTTR
jgi:hypothetical protein